MKISPSASAQNYNGEIQVILCNAIGQTLMKKNYTIHAEKLDIPVSSASLSQGIYFVILKTKEATATKKIIKY